MEVGPEIASVAACKTGGLGGGVGACADEPPESNAQQIKHMMTLFTSAPRLDAFDQEFPDRPNTDSYPVIRPNPPWIRVAHDVGVGVGVGLGVGLLRKMAKICKITGNAASMAEIMAAI